MDSAKVCDAVRVPMPRRHRGFGSKGEKIFLYANHLHVNAHNIHGYFYQYNVALFHNDNRPVKNNSLGRKIIDKVFKVHRSDLGGKAIAYDGENSLFTHGPLRNINMDFIVVLEEEIYVARRTSRGGDSPDRKRMRCANQCNAYRAEISYATKIPLQALADAMRGYESSKSYDARRVLDTIICQHAIRRGCLIVQRSLFYNDPSNSEHIGSNILGCTGFRSCFRTTRGGLSLNMDVTTTIVVKPGPVIDFILANQDVRDPKFVDWNKAKKTLKNLRTKVSYSNMEYKIKGLSDKSCREQTFKMKSPQGESEITVYEYFRTERKIELIDSADLPCISVGNSDRPTYVPLEYCTLTPLQRYTKSLNTFQRSALVKKSRQKPHDRMNVLSNALRICRYDTEPLLRSCGISISSEFTKVDGRILATPKMKMGQGVKFFPTNGRWNFNNKQFIEPVTIDLWIIVNFTSQCDTQALIKDLLKVGRQKGLRIADPYHVFEENPRLQNAPPVTRVDEMFRDIWVKFPKSLTSFILCLLPNKKSGLYGPWKKKLLTGINYGIVTQCLIPSRKPNHRFILSLLMKINAKLGGLNTMLSIERTRYFTVFSNIPTIIFGMAVSHGSPGKAAVPSIAAVVGSREWPLISKYSASVRTQRSKTEMIESLFKKNGTGDDGIIRELVLDFYQSSGQKKPKHIIIFRNGVCESQFSQVLNIELEQIIEACKTLDGDWNPKFLLIVAQKRHHTRFFRSRSPFNVPPGTIVDTKVCHPKNNDFYLCAHSATNGTSRPTHYHVLYDDIGFSSDQVQELVHSLSYVYQRSTTAISIVAPIMYAHSAAAQVGKFEKFEDQPESSHGAVTTTGGPFSLHSFQN